MIIVENIVTNNTKKMGYVFKMVNKKMDYVDFITTTVQIILIFGKFYT